MKIKIKLSNVSVDIAVPGATGGKGAAPLLSVVPVQSRQHRRQCLVPTRVGYPSLQAPLEAPMQHSLAMFV